MTAIGGQKLGGRGARPGGNNLGASHYSRPPTANPTRDHRFNNRVSMPGSQPVVLVLFLPSCRRRPTPLGSPEHPESSVGMRLKIADRGEGVHVRG